MKLKTAVMATLAALAIMVGSAFGATNVQSAGAVSSGQDVVVVEYKYTEIRHLPPTPYWTPYYGPPYWRSYYGGGTSPNPIGGTPTDGKMNIIRYSMVLDDCDYTLDQLVHGVKAKNAWVQRET